MIQCLQSFQKNLIYFVSEPFGWTAPDWGHELENDLFQK